MRATNLEFTTISAIIYERVCVPCMSMQRTPFASLIKSLKIQINLKKQAKGVRKFSRGCKSLIH